MELRFNLPLNDTACRDDEWYNLVVEDHLSALMVLGAPQGSAPYWLIGPGLATKAFSPVFPEVVHEYLLLSNIQYPSGFFSDKSGIGLCGPFRRNKALLLF